MWPTRLTYGTKKGAARNSSIAGRVGRVSPRIRAGQPDRPNPVLSGPDHGPRKVAAMPDDHALRVLRGVLNRLRSQPWERDRWSTPRVRAAREEALTRFGLLRSPEQVASIDKETFLGFLRCENNRHRMGFGRVALMTADLPRLREALSFLVDERLPLRTRLDRMRPPGGKPMVQGLGPGIITLILHFSDPDR